MRRLWAASVAVTALLLPALPATAGTAVGTADDASDRSDRAARGVSLKVTRLSTGLTIPWDVAVIDRGRLLITERESARLLVRGSGGRTRAVRFPSDEVWVSGETGLMSVEADPGFAENRRFYTCQGGTTANGHDVRVVAWRLNDRATRAEKARTLLRGIPATSGRHGGCRLLVLRDGSLLVGTGDAADERNPRNLRSLGGKTLRLDRFSGAPWPTNPFIDSPRRTTRYIHTYGHRNVQGLAQRKDGSLWSVEHGSYRDDEVNRLVKGGDYGWQPGPGYDESAPMTDHSLPGRQISAKWRSGEPTIATSGATFVRGKQWGGLNGTLAVAALGGARMVFMKFEPSGKLKWTRTPARLTRLGRLRSVTNAPNGDLLVTTSNGSNDAVVRVSPR